jgi:hypothetical protein
MRQYLNSDHFDEGSSGEKGRLAYELEVILSKDGKNGVLDMLSGYQKILSNNDRRDEWDAINGRLQTLFKCGSVTSIDGPMIGVSLSIRDTDYFRETTRHFGKERSVLANIEWMASVWNTTFGNSGIWMGKTFEPVSRETVAACAVTTRQRWRSMPRATPGSAVIFFRQPHNPTLLQLAGLPVLTSLWRLKDRPMNPDTPGFHGQLLAANLEAEQSIPYSKTGGLFLAGRGPSVLPEMNRKPVVQLNYRWPALGPVYPMTRLVDELVQVDTGIYLGQLIMATRNYSLGTLKLPWVSNAFGMELGVAFDPGGVHASLTTQLERQGGVYGYQNNGYFLMIDPQLALTVYADGVFDQLRPHPGEMGYAALGYDKARVASSPATLEAGSRHGATLRRTADWRHGWKAEAALAEKFTTFCLEPSPQEADGDVRDLLHEGESILQLLQRIQAEISAQTTHDDHLAHFETLNRLFRSGVAPVVRDGLFQGQGRGFNVRYNGLADRRWYGKKEPLTGFDYYHGATLNLHWGFGDAFRPPVGQDPAQPTLFPTSIAALLRDKQPHPNLLDMVWSSIARFIFPWAGKSFEKISGRKLSLLLDESDDLKARYPQRVAELKRSLASRPHYELVKMNARHHWEASGIYSSHLNQGPWDEGMSDEDRSFWNDLADSRWVFGHNLMDSRIMPADTMMQILDLNYRVPEKPLRELAEAGPSPFARMGYCFLGLAGASSILPMNNGPGKAKKVFQFHYRFPMIGGPVPIGACLDEIVEIAEGLYLGQLIYSTNPLTPFHSSVDPSDYAYQLFGYFLLLDNDWEYHRQAIGLDGLDANAVSPPMAGSGITVSS